MHKINKNKMISLLIVPLVIISPCASFIITYQCFYYSQHMSFDSINRVGVEEYIIRSDEDTIISDEHTIISDEDTIGT